MDNCLEGWQAVPLGVVLQYLEDEKERLWRHAGGARSENREKAYAGYNRAESLHTSLARVLAWLPEGQGAVLGAVAHGTGAPAPVAAGKGVCVLCRKGSRGGRALAVAMHQKCYRTLAHDSGEKA